MSEYIERARKLVAEHLGVDGDKVVAESSFADDLGADSLDCVELAMAIEEEFAIEMPDHEAERIFADGTFADLTSWLERQRAAA